jgi:ribosome biogenesis protein Nip4
MIKAYTHNFQLFKNYLRVFSILKVKGSMEFPYEEIDKIVIDNRATTAISSRVEIFLKNGKMFKFGFTDIKNKKIRQFILFIRKRDIHVKFFPRTWI